MKIFDQKQGWRSKVNFVDANNVFVGFDTDQCCCEHADWFIADTPKDTIEERDARPDEMAGWVFDRDYFEEVSNGREFDGGGMVIFRITKDGSEKFLHLFNCHNGYYSHGFTFGAGGVVEREGAI
tara:strand:- start:330 stop:704 length:375 start_codon:yes stop_codon:yes gene_type:complete